MMVVLPLPEGPVSKTNSPDEMLKETSFKAKLSSKKDLVILSKIIIATYSLAGLDGDWQEKKDLQKDTLN